MARTLLVLLVLLPLSALAAPQGSLDVQVNIEGAEITIDSKVVGKSPVRKRFLPAGQHTVKVTKAGYTQFLDVVELLAGEELLVEVELFAVAAPTTVTSDPPGATLFVDGKESGETPWTGDIGAGEHTLRLELEGYTPAEKVVTLIEGEPAEFELELAAIVIVEAPKPKKKPIYKKWPFWAGVGAAVVGVTTIVILTSGEGDPFGDSDRVITPIW